MSIEHPQSDMTVSSHNADLDNVPGMRGCVVLGFTHCYVTTAVVLGAVAFAGRFVKTSDNQSTPMSAGLGKATGLPVRASLLVVSHASLLASFVLLAAYADRFVTFCHRHPSARVAPALERSAAWDGDWYVRIVEHGYSCAVRHTARLAALDAGDFGRRGHGGQAGWSGGVGAAGDGGLVARFGREGAAWRPRLGHPIRPWARIVAFRGAKDDNGAARGSSPRGLPLLQELYLGHTDIGDGALETIGKIKSLRELELYQTDVTDDGLKHLAALTALDRLHLGDTKITDRGIADLAALSHLKKVWLNDTKLTDAAAADLRKLQRLEGLYLPKGVSQDTVDELKRALPKAEVRR